MKTEETRVDGAMYVFATAKSSYELDNLEPGELPFTYELKSYDYGDENCVRVHEIPVTGLVPAGIDITIACIKNLEEKIEALEKECAKEVEKLRVRIKALALIEFKPVVEEAEDGSPDVQF